MPSSIWLHNCKRSENILPDFPKKAESDEDIIKIINDGDGNGDNKIDLIEFVKIMNKS